VVSKITLPWDTEAGYGAVAFDGTVRLNKDFLSHSGMTKRQIQKGIDQTTQKVLRRVKKFRGFTMLVAIEALRNSGAPNICIAVPTGH
jgi:putative phosphoribosyl transferase